jgi:serine/threonine-protein kinase
MAELFLAYTSGPGGFRKFVALKQILPDVQTDEFVQMFLDEARITAAFSHPNIGQVFDLGLEDGELYLAMEFLPGQNLEQVLIAASRVRPLPIGFAARVARDVCLGLHYAHHFTAPSGRKVAVVHRDMAPRNVMITYDGVVKVIDFGIAKAKGRIARTHVGMVKGTSGYMSPEQVRGLDLDGRSDLFTAGVLLHEMLCGRRLFDTSNEEAMMRQIANADIEPPRTLNPDVPEALSAVVMRALAKEPAKRFATGREMAKAIEAAVGAEIFDEEAVAELMQALFAEKRLQTLALLDQPTNDDDRVSRIIAVLREGRNDEQTIDEVVDEDDPSDIRPTMPAIKLPAQQQPSRPPPARASSASSRNSSPPNPRPFPSSARQRPDGSPRKSPRVEEEEDAPTQIGPLPVETERTALPEPAARDSRRSPKIGTYTLGSDEPPKEAVSAPIRLDEDSETVTTAEVSRVSRVSQAWGTLGSSARRALWVALAMVVMGLAVLFMPESLRSRLGGLFASVGLRAPERTSGTEPQPEPPPQAQPPPEAKPPPEATPQAQPPPAAAGPEAGASTTLPSHEAYEPPPPAEAAGSETPAEPPSGPGSPSPSTPPTGTRLRKLDPTGARVPKSTRLGTKPAPSPAEAVEGAEDAADTSEEGTSESTQDALGEPPAPQPRSTRATKLPTKKQSKPGALAPSEPIEDPSESEESSVGPAEVDPSIQPQEIDSTPLEGEVN